jgi:hypothetical protein
MPDPSGKTDISNYAHHQKMYMKNIFLLALATALTVGQAALASDKPKHAKKACRDCTEKVCTPACQDHCGKGCCAKAH